jgi:periplasmic protein TonB
MAPSLKELESPVATTPASAPPAKPAPVALEIPVAVNGARTVEGSDKRVPFSESTQTVLVFPHGAVLRIATPLVSGQLVFLTNEKTKKEVVCQVVKSKSSGTAGSYVELQFTEPSPGFWGLQIPGPGVAPRPTASGPQPVAKSVAPPAPVSAAPPVAAKPIAPAPIANPPVKTVAPPPPVSAVSPSAAVVTPVMPVMATPDPVKTATSPVVAPLIAPNAEPAATVHASTPAHPEPPVPPLQDYSKQIEALFSSGQLRVAPALPEAPAARVSVDPTTEDLKVQAARLKEQLSSMLFTENPAAPVTPAGVPPVTFKPESPAADAPKNATPAVVLEEPKAVLQDEPKSAAPVVSRRKPAVAALGADEEVKIPSWLAPLSQASVEPTVATESAASPEAAHGQSFSVNPEESFDALLGSEGPRPQTAVFGGQLLGESTAPAASGSKKGLFLGLAAAVMVFAGGGWYFYQGHGGTATVAAHPAAAPSSSEAVPASPSAPAPSTAATNSTPAPVLQPSKRSVPNPAPEVVVPEPSARSAAVPPKTSAPVDDPSKPVLGDVHLAAPVVNRSANSQADSDGLPAIDAKGIPVGGDPFASGSQHPPAAPLPVGGDVKPAQLLKSVAPEYPAIAKAQHISGKVQIDALVDASGNVAAMKVISGPALLHHAATDAVKQWKYTPAMLDGQPTSMHLTVTLEFRGQ